MSQTITVTGIPGGDGECWCLKVTEEEYRRVVGEEMYLLEKESRANLEAQLPTLPVGPWRIYPGNLIPESNTPITLEIRVV